MIISFLAAYILPALVLRGAVRGGATVWTAFVFAVFVHTAIEYVFNKTVGASAPVFREEPLVGNLILYAYVPVQTAVVLVVLRAFADPTWSHLEHFGLALSTGTMTGAIGITAAHELVHRRTKTERGMGLFLLLQVLDMQFEIEHIRGHHKYVATAQDTSTARKGESVYAFVPRAVGAAVEFSAQIERAAGRTGVRSRLNQYLALQLLLLIAIGAIAGPWALLWFVVQSAVAIFYLEAVNYIEHYGLERHQLPNGRYEDVDETHSWDTYGALTNVYLFKLGFHSDHHIAAARPYPLLRKRDPSDVLPAGYSAMILLSLVPPFWRRVMDWRVDRRRLQAHGEPIVESA